MSGSVPRAFQRLDAFLVEAHRRPPRISVDVCVPDEYGSLAPFQIAFVSVSHMIGPVDSVSRLVWHVAYLPALSRLHSTELPFISTSPYPSAKKRKLDRPRMGPSVDPAYLSGPEVVKLLVSKLKAAAAVLMFAPPHPQRDIGKVHMNVAFVSVGAKSEKKGTKRNTAHLGIVTR